MRRENERMARGERSKFHDPGMTSDLPKVKIDENLKHAQGQTLCSATSTYTTLTCSSGGVGGYVVSAPIMVVLRTNA